jgi:ABC-type dipeptide/oligopeptide/nickel transport system permease subunit
MTRLRMAAIALLILIYAIALLADVVSPASYETQFRENIAQPPGSRFYLGTDELGRDRFARLLHGVRVSLLLAPTAAMLATGMAAILGLVAGYMGGWMDRIVGSTADMVISVPSLFLLLTTRAILPLNVGPFLSVTITFLLLGLLGWAGPARVVRAGVTAIRSSDYHQQAQACGCATWRLLLIHTLPNLRPVLVAQFWLLVPLFLLAEANLGMLGLGVTEPMPSLGTLIAEMQSVYTVCEAPWIAFPAFLLLVVLGLFHLIISRNEFAS